MPKSPHEMKHRLFVDKVMTVGFVTEGDDPEAELVFFKSLKKEAETFAEVGNEDQIGNEIWDMTNSISRAIRSAVFEADDDQDPAAIINDSLDQFEAAVRAAAPLWLAGNPVQKHQGHTMPKFDKSKLDDVARTEFDRLEREATDAAEAQQTAEEAQATAEGLTATEKARADEAEAKVEDLTPEEDEVKKGMSPEAREHFEKLEKRLDDEVQRRETDVMAIRFAKGGDLEHMSGDKRTEVLLKAKGGMDDADWDELDTMLKAASAQIAEGNLLKEAGVEGEPEAGEAETEFTAEVKKLRDADPKMTPAEATTHIARTNAPLFKRVQAERKANA